MTPVGLPYLSVATRRSVSDLLKLLPPDREPRDLVSCRRWFGALPFFALRDPCLNFIFSSPLVR